MSPGAKTSAALTDAVKAAAPRSEEKVQNYGFVIDNRRCIGCHACTVACKSEHNDPIGINKTWVTYMEKGVFPNATREFHVMRCNHCADAPCVEICPTASLITRKDGIVDFDSDRCIGCKSCMQACPYDALTIDPITNTATKCNFCSHRIDVGRAPACVSVCPVEAIIPGDISNPESKIAQLLAREKTIRRKPEKGTQPKLFYIEGDRAALEPSASIRSTTTLWGTRQSDGVDEVAPKEPSAVTERGLLRRTYDISQRHAVSWGWKVSAYLFTKSIAAGVFMLPVILGFFYNGSDSTTDQAIANMFGMATLIALLTLGITGALLVADLKKPERFLWVLLRPQWRSWLARGAYIVTAYAILLTLWLFIRPDATQGFGQAFAILGALLAGMTAAYSGWLFGQAKGRDLWQSPIVPLHLLIQALVAGCATYALLGEASVLPLLKPIFIIALCTNLLMVGLDVWGRHTTADAKRAAIIMRTGERGILLWGLVIVLGHLLPTILISCNLSGGFVAIIVWIGLATYEHLWIDAPQRVALA